MVVSEGHQTRLLAEAEKQIDRIQGDSTTPDEYRELCVRALALKIGQILDVSLKNPSVKKLQLDSALEQLISITVALPGQQNFSSSEKELGIRTKELIKREHDVFILLREIADKFLLVPEMLEQAKQVACSGSRFAEQCKANPMCKNKHVDACQIAALLQLTRVYIQMDKPKLADEQLAKARFAIDKMRVDKNASVLPPIETEPKSEIDPESMEYLETLTLNVQGQLYSSMQDYEKALEIHAHEIIASNRYFSVPLSNYSGFKAMAFLFQKMNKIPLAVHYFQKALEIWENGSSSICDLNLIDYHNTFRTIIQIKQALESYDANVKNRKECLNLCETVHEKFESLSEKFN